VANNDRVTDDVIADDMSEAARPTIADLFSRLAEQAGALARAEFSVYRAEAGRHALAAGVAAGLIAAAIVLAQGALVALLVGLIVLLAESLGTGWAIVAVVGGALLVAALMGWFGVRRVRAIIDPEVK